MLCFSYHGNAKTSYIDGFRGRKVANNQSPESPNSQTFGVGLAKRRHPESPNINRRQAGFGCWREHLNGIRVVIGPCAIVVLDSE
jgi:hypothetical protein